MVTPGPTKDVVSCVVLPASQGVVGDWVDDVSTRYMIQDVRGLYASSHDRRVR